MSVIRVKKAQRKPYVILDTTALNDPGLSFRAKGLHTYLMAKPDDWQVYIEQLEQISPREGRDAIRSAMKELEENGYIKRTRNRGEKGRMVGWDTTIYETPGLLTNEARQEAQATSDNIGLVESPKSDEPKSDEPKSDEPKSDEPKSDEPKSDEPKSANPQLLSIDLNQGLKRSKIEGKNSLTSFESTPPPPEGGVHTAEQTSGTKRRRTPKPATAYTPGFLAWWDAYPDDRVTEKDKCFTYWQEHHLEDNAGELVAKIERLKLTQWNVAGAERRFIKTSLPYLNDERYKAALVPFPSFDPVAENVISAKGMRSAQASQRLMDRLKEDHHAPQGPSPFFQIPRGNG